jgi:hypothetical protein
VVVLEAFDDGVFLDWVGFRYSFALEVDEARASFFFGPILLDVTSRKRCLERPSFG